MKIVVLLFKRNERMNKPTNKPENQQTSPMTIPPGVGNKSVHNNHRLRRSQGRVNE